MPYSIQTKDGIVIDGIPDTMAHDAPELQTRVQQARAQIHKQNLDAQIAKDKAEFDPSKGGGTLQFGPLDTGIETPQWLQRGLAGLGKSAVDVGRTARVLGDPGYTAQDAKADTALDKPLMDTGAGLTGNIAGQVAMTAFPALRGAQAFAKGGQLAGQAIRMGAPAMESMLPHALRTIGATAVEKAAPVVGASAVNAAVGAATSPEDMAQGAKIGAVTGPLAEAGGRAVGAGWDLVRPEWAKGAPAVLRRALEAKAADPAAVRATLDNPPAPLVIGSKPTLAEITGDPGIAQFQRAAGTRIPEVANAIQASDQARVGAYQDTLKKLAGSPQEQTDAADAFAKQGKAAYDNLFAIPVDMNKQPVEVLQRAASLQQRPAIQQAMKEAQETALNDGRAFTGANSLRGLNDMKIELDGMIKNSDGARKKSIQAAQGELIQLMDDLSSGMYSVTKDVYTDLARPVNQQAIAEHLLKKGFPAINAYDPHANLTRTRATAYTNALEDAATARRATGQNVPLDRMLEPEQLGQVTNIGRDMARRAGADEAGLMKGQSATAQLMPAGADIASHLGLHALDAMTGIPVGTIKRVYDWTKNIPYNLGESGRNKLLAQVFTDPVVAKQVMNAPDAASYLRIIQPYVAQATSQAALAKAQQ